MLTDENTPAEKRTTSLMHTYRTFEEKKPSILSLFDLVDTKISSTNISEHFV